MLLEGLVRSIMDIGVYTSHRVAVTNRFATSHALTAGSVEELPVLCTQLYV